MVNLHTFGGKGFSNVRVVCIHLYTSNISVSSRNVHNHDCFPFEHVVCLRIYTYENQRFYSTSKRTLNWIRRDCSLYLKNCSLSSDCACRRSCIVRFFDDQKSSKLVNLRNALLWATVTRLAIVLSTQLQRYLLLAILL